jgi:hypothetical protein
MNAVASAGRAAQPQGRKARSGRRWSDLSPREKAGLLTLASIELALTATAVVDLYRRQPDMVRGPRALWWPAIFIQPVGPVAYLAFGRRR